MKISNLKKQFNLVGVEEQVDFNVDFTLQIAKLQDQLFSKLNEIQNITNLDSYIAYWSNKSNPCNESQEPAIYYLAAVEVSEVTKIPEGLIAVVLPESEYAVFQENFRGEIGGPEGYAYTTFLPNSGRELNPMIPGDLEIYSSRDNIQPTDPCEIYIPLK